MNEKSTLFRNTFKLALAMILNKILGYLRDAIFVWVLGCNYLTDLYYINLRFLAFLRRILGEGALNITLLPYLSVTKSEENREDFISRLCALSFFISFVLVFFIIFFRYEVLSLIGGNLMKEDRYSSIAVTVLSIMSLHIVFLSLYAIFQGVLNFKNIFFRPAMVQSFFSIFIIIALLIFKNSVFIIYYVAILAVFSGAAQLMFLINDLKKEGFYFKLKSPFVKEIWSFFVKSINGAISFSYEHFLFFITLPFMSYLKEGSVTAFYNSSRIIQFPLTLISSSIAMASLKEISIYYSEKKEDLFFANFFKSIRLNLLIIIPAACGLFMLAEEISIFLFRHGKFTYQDANYTAEMLRIISVSLPFIGLNKIFISFFYSAHQSNRTILMITFSFLLHFIVSFIFLIYLKISPVYVIVISPVFSFIIFSYLLFENFKIKFSDFSGVYLMKIIISTILMSLWIKLLKAWDYFLLRNTLVIIVSSILVFYFSLRVLKISFLEFFYES